MYSRTLVLALLVAYAGDEGSVIPGDGNGNYAFAGSVSRGMLEEPPRFSPRLYLRGDTIPVAAVHPTSADSVPAGHLADEVLAEPRKHRLASYLALGTALGAGAVLYYKTPGLQDFDQGFAEAWRQRFSRIDRHRFDDNAFGMNHINHSVAGRGYYGIARAGNLSAREAVLFTALGSSIWEYLIEIREVVSLNDQIVTIGAGSVFGEALYQHQSYLLERQDLGSRHAAAAWILGFPFALPKLLAGSDAGTCVPRADGRMMTREFTASHSSMYAGPREGAGGVQLRLASSVRKIPSVASPGRRSEVITGIPLSHLSVEISPGERRTEIFSAVSPRLWSLSEMRQNDDGSLRGFRLLLGPSWSFRMSTRTDALEDRAATTALLGMVKELELSQGSFTAAWTSDASFDFSSIHAHALPAYREEGSLDGAKAVLKHGYYYGYGVSVQSRTEFGTQHFGIEAEGLALGVRSIQGLDRWQEDVVDDFALSDTRVRWQAGGVWKITPRMDLALTRRGRSWAGRAKEAEASSRENDTATTVRLRF
jgi:hypothetical protein